MSFFSKRGVFSFLIVAALGAGMYAVFRNINPGLAPLLPTEEESALPKRSVIGASVEGRPLESFTYGSGGTHLAFIGGIHGGYEWNTVLLAYTFLDYLDENPEFIPEHITVTVIPSANPDGVYKVVGKEGRFTAADAPAAELAPPGRFNAHGVDLNRNFDCKWKPEAVWRGKKVSAGAAPFSEPEARAIRDFALAHRPDAVVSWHSQANTVYASFCEDDILPATLDIMHAYAKAAGYAAQKTFDAYAVTGDADGWLASIDIPAITVELKTHETIEWEQNLEGIKALFAYYAAR